jgi:hypothetical protein
MKKVLAVLAFFAAAVGTHAQSGQAFYSRVAGLYNATLYNQYSVTEFNSVGTGSQVIVAGPAFVTLADGRVVNPFGTNVPLSIDLGANNEVVTPSAVSLTSCPTGVTMPNGGQCVNLTVSLSNAHGIGTKISSGDSGMFEAFNDASNNGGGNVYWEVDCGVIVLNTGAATTTSSCLTPKTTTTQGVSVRVTTTITTSASYSIGIATATTAYATSCTSLTAGQDCSQFVAAPTKVSTGAGTGALLITANATAGAGAVHIKVWGIIGVQSNF